MKRVIKFRAWDGKKMLLPEFTNISDFFIEADGTASFMQEVWREGLQIASHDSTFEIMQFTGLKDKVGVEIWEGDIVEAIFNIQGKESSIKFNAKIIYNSYIGSFQISYRNMDDHFVSDTMYSRYFLRVIGNIYENSELI